jgi:hypothetical protein
MDSATTTGSNTLGEKAKIPDLQSGGELSSQTKGCLFNPSDSFSFSPERLTLLYSSIKSDLPEGSMTFWQV